METWQIDIVDKNVPYLIENTRCTTSLKAFLRMKKMISAEEEDRLSTMRNSSSCYQETKELYEILKTRCGGYEAIVKGLQETRQTGAWNFLQEQKKKYALTRADPKDNSQNYFKLLSILITILVKLFWALYNVCDQMLGLDDPVDNLLDVSVQFAGEVKSLKDVLPKFTADDAKTVLDSAIRMEKSNSISLQLDGELAPPPTLYVSRSISNRWVVDPKVFTKDCTDVFVFKNVDRRELVHLVEPYVTRSSTNQRTKVTCKHIYLDDDDDWADLTLVCKQPIHLVCKEGNEYVLQRSNQFSSIIFDNLMRKSTHKEAYISEDEFVEHQLTCMDTAGALICDVPGMGKTWLMQSIARKLQNKSVNSFVFYVQLARFSKVLVEKIRSTERRGIKTLEYILNYVCKSTLAGTIFSNYATRNNCNFRFVLDGFDEIRDQHMRHTTSFIKNLNNIANVQLIISSRPRMRVHLQNIFKLVSYDILPFDWKDQVKLIVGCWMEKIPGGDEQTLVELVEKSVQGFKKLQNNDRADILGVPLKCFLFAEINAIHAELLSKPKRRKSNEIQVLTVSESVAELYDRFVAVSVRKAIGSQGGLKQRDLCELIANFHTYKALQLLFPSISEAYYTYFGLNSSVTEQIVKVGVLFRKANSELEFIHRSFAEYFVGKFFAEFFINVGEYTIVFRHDVIRCFITDALSTSNRVVLKDPPKFEEAYLKSDAWKDIINKITLNYFPVVWFMNSIHERTHDLSPVPIVFSDLNIVPLHMFKFSDLRYLALVACIQQGLTSIFPLVLHLVKRLSIGRHEHRQWMPLLLHTVASNGLPESAHKLVNTLKDPISQVVFTFGRTFLQNHLSPLEVAIWRNDLDMVVFFADKIRLPSERLLLVCLRNVGFQKHSRVCIIERILSKETIKDILCSTGTNRCLSAFYDLHLINVDVLTTYAWKHGLDSKQVSQVYTRRLLATGFRRCNDTELMKLLLWVFGKRNWKYYEWSRALFVEEPESSSESGYLHELNAETVLEALDFSSARKRLLVMKLDWNVDCFRFVNRVETLKILTAIHSDLSGFNAAKNNYLHLAVQ